METPRIGHNGGPDLNCDWVAISRDMRSHPLVGFGQPMKPADPKRGAYSKAEAWQDLIMEARWKRKKVKNKGRMIWLERGELLGARRWLADRWNWTEMAVRWFLSQLENDLMISRNRSHSDNRAHGHSIGVITIRKYDLFQLERDLENLLSNQDDNHSATTQQPLNNHTETRKQDKQEDSVPDGTGAEAPPGKSLREIVWDEGIAWLRPRAHTSEARLRTRIGGWIKDHGDAAVLDAIVRAQKAEPVSVMSYIEGILRRKANGSGHWAEDRDRRHAEFQKLLEV